MLFEVLLGVPFVVSVVVSNILRLLYTFIYCLRSLGIVHSSQSSQSPSVHFELEANVMEEMKSDSSELFDLSDLLLDVFGDAIEVKFDTSELLDTSELFEGVLGVFGGGTRTFLSFSFFNLFDIKRCCSIVEFPKIAFERTFNKTLHSTRHFA